MESLGASARDIEEWRGRQVPRAFAVYEENLPAVELFVASQTQWRFAGAAGMPVGLDYTGVEAAARMLTGEAPSPALFADLRLMEAAALSELAKRWRK